MLFLGRVLGNLLIHQDDIECIYWLRIRFRGSGLATIGPSIGTWTVWGSGLVRVVKSRPDARVDPCAAKPIGVGLQLFLSFSIT